MAAPDRTGLARGALVVVEAEQLETLIREVVSEALESLTESSREPDLKDRAGIARAIGVSPGTIDKLRREGMPEIKILDSPRFILADCIEWLRARGAR